MPSIDINAFSMLRNRKFWQLFGHYQKVLPGSWSSLWNKVSFKRQTLTASITLLDRYHSNTTTKLWWALEGVRNISAVLLNFQSSFTKVNAHQLFTCKPSEGCWVLKHVIDGGPWKWRLHGLAQLDDINMPERSWSFFREKMLWNFGPGTLSAAHSIRQSL